MDSELRVAAGLLLLGVVLLGATSLYSADPVRIHDTSATSEQVSGQLPPGTEYREVEYEAMSDRGQEIYRDALRSGGTVRTSEANAVDRWRYDEPSYVTVVRPENGSLPPVDEPDPDSRRDVMALNVGTAEPPVWLFGLSLLGQIGGVLALLSGFALVVLGEGGSNPFE